MEPFCQFLPHGQTVSNAKKNTKSEVPNLESIENEATLLQSLRAIIAISSTNSQDGARKKDWHSVLTQLLKMLCCNREIGNQTILLASHAFLSLRRFVHSFEEFERNVITYFDVSNQVNQIQQFEEVYAIRNIDIFKQVICHGYLQLNQKLSYSSRIYTRIIEIVYPHCIEYTQHTYFSFKILQSWLFKSSTTSFWVGHTRELEQMLETVLFSNWDNTISRTSVVAVLTAYLSIMKEKYEGFLPYLFYRCVENISWHHVSKYTILAEICHSLNDNDLIKERKFVSNLFNSLTCPHLCNASTKVFLCISNKLSQDEWKATFGEILRSYVTAWESEKERSALQVLCRYWIEPLVKIHRDLLLFLAECCDGKCSIYLSHLLRLSRKYGASIPILDMYSFDYLNHEEEFIRLNIFAAHSYAQDDPENDHYLRSIQAVESFLFFNATTSSTYLREGILHYFKIFLSGLLKRASVSKETLEAVKFFEWLYDFEMDCFEIASCYQRKIFGLSLYKLCLQFLFGSKSTDCFLSKDPVFRVALSYGPSLQEKMKKMGRWRYTEKQRLITLLKLVLDSATDVRENSVEMVVEFFDPHLLNHSEKNFLFTMALDKCNSYKFSEIESGACLLKILSEWFDPHDFEGTLLNSENIPRLPVKEKFPRYTRFLLGEIRNQLNLLKRDILKAATQNSPCYGVVTALLSTAFKSGPECNLITEPLLEEILTLLEEAVQDFLSMFSSKSSGLGSDFSSSFKEMGIAVDDAIRRSELDYEFDELVLCELAVEIVRNKYVTDPMIQRASQVIVSVSLKCRHKGVIESAGYAVGNLVRYLCKNKLSMEVLESYVEKLINNDFASSINLTRRGAGITILFHRIIANDIRTDRPLFHFAVNSLVHSLVESRMPTRKEKQDGTVYDDPRAIRLHFLKSLVADKQLQAQLNPYLDRICLICLDYMTSSTFTVRNASFQLYGALITRFVGQNWGAKGLDFGYGYSVNHFATHFPQLAAHVLARLRASCRSLDEQSSWQENSDVVHILPLLSKMFFSGCELIDGSSSEFVNQIKDCLYRLLNSPLAHVRISAAKCLVAFTGTHSSHLDREEHRLVRRLKSSNSFNHRNGCLQALEYLMERKIVESVTFAADSETIGSLCDVQTNVEVPELMECLWNFWSRRLSLMNHQNVCYAIEAQMIRLSRKSKLITHSMSDQESEPVPTDCFIAPFNPRKPGFFEFVDELMRLFVGYLYSNNRRELLKDVLESECQYFCHSLCQTAPRNDVDSLLMIVDFVTRNFLVVDEYLLQSIVTYTSKSIRVLLFNKEGDPCDFRILEKLENFAHKISDDSSTSNAHFSELLMYIHLYSHRHSESSDPLKSATMAFQNQDITFANYFSYPDSLRHLISKGLEILLHDFQSLNSNCKKLCFLWSLTLLRDEITSIREAIEDSVLRNVLLPHTRSNIKISSEIVQITLLLNLIPRKAIVGELNHEEFVQIIQQYLSTFAKSSSLAPNLETPFDDDGITCYKEESQLLNVIVFCFARRSSQSARQIHIESVEDIREFVFGGKPDLLKKLNVDPHVIQAYLTISQEHYLAKKMAVIQTFFGN
ncbi:hypothetical protein QAD02_021985, partial [Eretmocerus hayati]